MFKVHLPNKDRSRARIDPELRELIRSCFNGLEPWPLTILGSVGGGKTCAALCALDASYGKTGYWPLGDLHSNLVIAGQGKLSDDHGKISPRFFWNEWRESDLTCLDEIGTREKSSDALYETCKRAIDIREGSPAVYISNLPLEGISRCFDDRIASRLSEGTVFDLEAEDRRIG